MVYIKNTPSLSDFDKSLLIDVRFVTPIFDFDIVPNDQGDIDAIVGKENVREALYRRLVTPKGALFWAPEYGTRLLELHNEPASTSNLSLMEAEVYQAVIDEQRLDDDANVRVENDGEKINIVIQATIKGSNIAESFTFAIEVTG